MKRHGRVNVALCQCRVFGADGAVCWLVNVPCPIQLDHVETCLLGSSIWRARHVSVIDTLTRTCIYTLVHCFVQITYVRNHSEINGALIIRRDVCLCFSWTGQNDKLENTNQAKEIESPFLQLSVTLQSNLEGSYARRFLECMTQCTIKRSLTQGSIQLMRVKKLTRI